MRMILLAACVVLPCVGCTDGGSAGPVGPGAKR